MTKSEAINNFGLEIVEKARDLYETDFGKVLFIEDCTYEDDIPCNPKEIIDYIQKAKSFREE